MAAVDRTPKAINYAANVGHSALRTWAMGERAFEEEADEDDLGRMEVELGSAMRAGAIGLTTSRSRNHATSDDRPVASRLASWNEVQRLVAVLARERAGVFELALEEAARSQDTERRAEVLQRLRRLALDTGVPVSFGVVAGYDDHLLQLIDDVAEAGGTMFGQSHCRGIATLLSFRTRLPFDRLPEWRDVRTRPADEQLAALTDPSVRARLVHAAEHGDFGRSIGAEARRPDFDHMYVMDAAVPPHATVAEVAAARGVAPVEAMIDLAVASRLEQLFIQPITPEDPDVILPFLRHQGSVMTFSDSGAHVSQVMDSSIQTHLLAFWVRQRQELALEEAVRMLTSATADAWGFTDRGRLQAGMAADLNVFDPDTVAPSMPEVVTDLPGGARRLRQGATGFKATIVAGQVVLADGESTGVFPGRLLRDGSRHDRTGRDASRHDRTGRDASRRLPA
jgi:N-acyl-D-aspartate/D-glutamate deacylase